MSKLASPSWIGPGLLLLFLLPAVGYAAYSVADRWYQGYVLGLEEEQLRRDIELLRQRNLALQAELERSRGDAYIEKVAREQLQLVKPGDRAILLIGPTPSQPPDPAPRQSQPQAPQKPAWRKVLDSLFPRQTG